MLKFETLSAALFLNTLNKSVCLYTFLFNTDMNIVNKPSIPILMSTNDPDLFEEIQAGAKTLTEKVKLIPAPSLQDALGFLSGQSDSAQLMIIDSRVLLANYTGLMERFESSSIDVPVLLLVWPEHVQVVRPARHAGIEEWLVIDRDKVYSTILPEVMAKALDASKNGCKKASAHDLLKLSETPLEKQESNPVEVVERASGSTASTDLLAMMSHEIRTPINSISGFIQLLQQTDLDPTQEEYTRVIQSNGRYLTGLTEEILDYAKLEAGRMTLQHDSFEVEELIHEIESDVALAAEAKSLRINIQIDRFMPRYIEGDRVRIKQGLIHLLENAIRNSENGEIRIEVSAQPRERNGEWKIRLTVSDSGPGISPEEQESLFDPMKHDCVSLRGRGLGLAICHKLAELMGGTCWVDSSTGKGAAFHFTFHAEERFAASEERVEDPSSLINPKLGEDCPLRILIAEDDENNCRMLKEFLEFLGYHDVETARNGRDALEKLHEGKFDIALMDVRLPDLSGVEVTRRMRNDEADTGMQKTRIVAITAYSMPGDEESFLKAGMDAYLGKPLDLRKLQDVLREAAGEVHAA